MPDLYLAGSTIYDTFVLRDGANAAITGKATGDFATAEAYIVATPATTASVTITHLNNGEYRISFTPSSGGSLIPTGNGAYRAYTSGNYTLGLADRFVTMDPTGSARTFTCLSAVGIAGWEYIIRHSGATGTVIFNPDGTETVGGATTKTLAAGALLHVISDGANWQIVSSQGTVT